MDLGHTSIEVAWSQSGNTSISEVFTSEFLANNRSNGMD
jgi:hypothetical protein